MLKQLSVFLENRSGQLVQITEILTKSSVNIRAINIAETNDYGVLRLVVDDNEKALSVLKDEGFIVKTANIVAAAVPDSVGGLNKLLLSISKHDIDIDYMYSIFGKSDGLAYMIFKVKNPDQLINVLQEDGYNIAGPDALGIN
ncbi:MAG: ACT domain-containing protein [Clostridia bacterium]|nr:ACT domain-containing protein [Clostridia bacterium]